ncbi:hypothetical protein FSP39_013892 [Pinctada imbricata]|uniref:Uncharacterized protein n=1 Tax=Pinctada imbricata TaxID=66713 RepID=A0AA88XS71_PINIB|nr:hypothetical protein FSP39_013892 [Pinctada imbricata]
MESKSTSNNTKKKKRDFCTKCSLWILISIVLGVVAFLAALTVWTIISYRDRVQDLEGRVVTLEVEYESFKDNIDGYILQTIESAVSKVSFQYLLENA